MSVVTNLPAGDAKFHEQVEFRWDSTILGQSGPGSYESEGVL